MCASQPKSLYRNCVGISFYGTENDIWAGFGPVSNIEKKRFGPILRAVFSCFQTAEVLLPSILHPICSSVAVQISLDTMNLNLKSNKRTNKQFQINEFQIC